MYRLFYLEDRLPPAQFIGNLYASALSEELDIGKNVGERNIEDELHAKIESSPVWDTSCIKTAYK